MIDGEIPTGWGLSLYGKDDEKYEQFQRLMRVSIPSYKAELMATEGWTVEKVAIARVDEIRKYSGDNQISAIWIYNAARLLERGL